MYKIDTPEYGRGKTLTENLIQKVGLRQRRSEFAHDHDRALNWSCSVRSQAFSPCTPEVGVYESCTYRGGEGQLLSRILKLAGCNHVNYLISRMLLNVPKSS